MSQAGALDTSGGGGSSVTEIDTDAGFALPLAGIINIFGGAGITTSAAGNTVTITFTGNPGLIWSVVTSANNPVTLVNRHGYISKGASPVQFALPPAAAIGDTFRIVGYGNLWTITQNAGQTLTLGMLTTTTGVFGAVTATMVTDAVEIVCVSTNLEFFIVDSIGNPTMV